MGDIYISGTMCKIFPLPFWKSSCLDPYLQLWARYRVLAQEWLFWLSYMYVLWLIYCQKYIKPHYWKVLLGRALDQLYCGSYYSCTVHYITLHTFVLLHPTLDALLQYLVINWKSFIKVRIFSGRTQGLLVSWRDGNSVSVARTVEVQRSHFPSGWCP